jgi:purine-binding chemotaxis protein CheW
MNTIVESSQLAGTESAACEFVTAVIAGQMFGIPVLQVQDVLGPQRITKIPLAPPRVAGALNLRGRIVTAIEARSRLGLEIDTDRSASMSIVSEHKGELYSLLVDSVGEVMALSRADIQVNPSTLDQRWRNISTGIVKLDGSLMVIMDIARLIEANEGEIA